ncbi:MAG: ABC-type antimicrobial peptide transport system, permease component, partial [Flavipsychrobacter sp.]|nr:ABC-type antimicrobial peptide transport system, permease component [Flavipsychrobacter sp.]
LIPWEYLTKTGQDYPYWGNNFCRTYVELQPNASEEVVNNKIRRMVITHAGYETNIEFFLHSVKKWQLYSEFENGKVSGGRITYVWMVGLIAAFILLIACINFMNLATARSERRAKEVAIRKVIGATKQSLIRQFLTESVIIALIALVLAVGIAWLVLPMYNGMVGKRLVLQFGNPLYWLVAIVIVLFTGLLAGSYPAFYLSAFQPVSILKSTFNLSKRSVNPRKVLVVFQFIISIALIICTIIIQQQIQHARNRPTGYNSENAVYHYLTGDLNKNYAVVKQELLSSGTATAVCQTSNPITQSGNNTLGVSWEGSPPNNNVLFDLVTASDGFTEFFGIKLIAGRDLNIEKFPSDTLNCIVSESAARAFGFKDPIGKKITHDTDLHIVGVFKDFIWGSPFERVNPMIVHAYYLNYNIINMRLNPKRSLSDNMQSMERIFKKYNPAFPFELHFVDESYASKFVAEQVIGKLAKISAGLAILISCLGLFGLAAFTAEKRAREIGIRRVIGASIMDIVTLLSKEFIILVLVAALVAFPLAWYTMHSWLQNYTYRVTITAGVFIISGLLAMIIAIATVSLQAIKAAKANPVKSLRSE